MISAAKLLAVGSQASLFSPFILFVLLGYTHLDCVAQYLPSTKIRNPAYLITAHHGAVASENERCSFIGVEILKEGGNAVDAAIAATFCTGVVNMFSYAWIRFGTEMATHDTSLFH